MVKKYLHKVALISLLCIIMSMTTGCYHYHYGYYFPEEKQAQIELGKTSKNEVLQLLGTPTFTNEPVNNTLVYASQNSDAYMFIKNSLKTRKIFAYDFDEKNILYRIRIYDETDTQDMDMNNIHVVIKKPNQSWAMHIYRIF